MKQPCWSESCHLIYLGNFMVILGLWELFSHSGSTTLVCMISRKDIWELLTVSVLSSGWNPWRERGNAPDRVEQGQPAEAADQQGVHAEHGGPRLRRHPRHGRGQQDPQDPRDSRQVRSLTIAMKINELGFFFKFCIWQQIVEYICLTSCHSDIRASCFKLKLLKCYEIISDNSSPTVIYLMGVFMATLKYSWFFC